MPLDQQRMATPPANLEAEIGLLAAIVAKPESYEVVAGIIQPDHFSEAEHARLYTAIEREVAAGRRFSVITLSGEFDKQWMARLAGAAVTTLNNREYGRAILECWQKRKLARLAAELDAEAYSVTGSAEHMREMTEGCLTALSAAGGDEGGLMSLSEFIHPTLEEIQEAARNRGRLMGVTTGLADLDDRTGGLLPGELYVVAGRTSMGKSTLAVTIAAAAARSGNHVAYFSLEMSGKLLTQWLFAAAADIPATRQRRGQVEAGEIGRLVEASSELHPLPLYIDDAAYLALSKIRARCRKLKRQHGLGLIVVDHLGLMAASAEARRQGRTAEITEITGGLKRLAKELNVPIVALSQLNRALEAREDKRPTLADLRDCLPGNALVLNADTGERIAVSDIVSKKLRFNVWALDDRYRLNRRPISDAWPIGEQGVLKVTTTSGRTLRCTAGHKLRTVSGWRELRSLHVGASVAVPRKYSAPIMGGERISEDQALLLGWLIGDGHLRGSAVLTVSSSSEVDLAIDLARRSFGIRPFAKSERADTPAVRIVMTTGRMCGAGKNPLTSWLRRIGAWGMIGQDKRVPQLMFLQQPAVIAAFLRGLFHADGCLTSSGNSATAKLSTISGGLARDAQHLLLRLGISAFIKADRRNIGGFRTTTKEIWTVSMQGRAAVAEFLSQVGFLADKHARAIARFKPVLLGDASQFDRIPIEINERVRELRAAAGLSHTALGWREQGKRMSRKTCAVIAERLADDDLSALASSDVVWDEIASIESDGSEMVYDISVGADHSFCVDDVVSHNSGSIEQDADAVIFCYRREYYLEREKPERRSSENDEKFAKRQADWQDDLDKSKGLCDLIIAKQRSGPLATVGVRFEPERSRMVNAGEWWGK